MSPDLKRKLEFKSVDFVPLAGLITMYNRNTARTINYPLETYGERTAFIAYQLLSTAAAGSALIGLYSLAERTLF